jgi:PAS domain S-box-containing protein
MEKRYRHIYKLLTAYAAGDFERRVPLSERRDEVDGVIIGMHMLGEELREATVSKELFAQIFNSVSEMLLVLDGSGKMMEMNGAVVRTLGFDRELLIGSSVDRLGLSKDGSLFRAMTRKRGQEGFVRLWHRSLLTAAGGTVPVDMEVKDLPGMGPHRRAGILVTARDIAQGGDRYAGNGAFQVGTGCP